LSSTARSRSASYTSTIYCGPVSPDDLRRG
jgi:hypothetical protein